MKTIKTVCILAVCLFAFNACNDEKSECGNGVLESGEACDGTQLGSQTCSTFGMTGSLSCKSDCTFDLSTCTQGSAGFCGDGIKNDDEQCDKTDFGGLTCTTYGMTGTISCKSDCMIDLSTCTPVSEVYCGDGIKNGTEQCDKYDLGGATCTTYGMTGTISCKPDCSLDLSTCTQESAEICGDGIKNGDEQCDNEDFGTATCASVDPARPYGRLGCTDDCKIAAIFCGKADMGLQAPMPDYENTDAQCSNGINDFHTQTKYGTEASWFDCKNNVCTQSPLVQYCQGTENTDKACSDGIDNQTSHILQEAFRDSVNFLTDCEDPSCFKNWRVTVCGEKSAHWELGPDCIDGEDNDSDGLTDCEDPDCLHAGVSQCVFPAVMKRVLFDNAHHEIAGTVDWIIDVTGRHPYPSMPKKESDWHGSLSEFARDLILTGDYIPETLPQDRVLTYNNSQNPQDLAYYSILVLPEPSSKISEEESKAIYNFVNDGGSLLIIADHEGADRDGNGYDAVRAINEMLAAMPGATSKESNPFGFYVLPGSFGNSKSAVADGAEPGIVSNRAGKLSSTGIYGAAEFRIVDTSKVKPLLKDSKTSSVFALTANIGEGRVVAVGDSAIIGDGTNFLGLFMTTENGYVDHELDNRILFLNAIDWLAGK